MRPLRALAELAVLLPLSVVMHATVFALDVGTIAIDIARGPRPAPRPIRTMCDEVNRELEWLDEPSVGDEFTALAMRLEREAA
jgi:hypothetical protein